MGLPLFMRSRDVSFEVGKHFCESDNGNFKCFFERIKGENSFLCAFDVVVLVPFGDQHFLGFPQ